MSINTSVEQNRSMRPGYGLAALVRGDHLVPWAFERRGLRPNNIAVKIQFCGVCHSDLHAIRGTSRFPLIPGHEMVGKVTALGAEVTKFQIGNAVVVGTIRRFLRLLLIVQTPFGTVFLEGVTTAYLYPYLFRTTSK